MDKRSKVLITLFLVLFFVVGAYRYKEMVVERNFVIYAHSSCDIAVESCFVADCDESDPECDQTPYRKIEKTAKNIPECSPAEDCAELMCQEGEKGCVELYCSEETLEDDEMCLDVASPSGTANVKPTEDVPASTATEEITQ